MISYRYLLTVACLLAVSVLIDARTKANRLNAHALFEEMHERMMQVQEMFMQPAEAFSFASKNSEKRWYKSINLDETTKLKDEQSQAQVNQAVVVLTEIAIEKPEELKSYLEEDGSQLVVEAGAGKIILQTEDNLLQITVESLIKSGSTKSDTTQEDAPSNQYISQSFERSSLARTFKNNLKLEDATVELKKEEKTLTITIPQETKVVKQIAVTIR